MGLIDYVRIEPAISKIYFFSLLAGGGPGSQTARHPIRNTVKGTLSMQKPSRDKSKLNGRGDVSLTKSVPQPGDM